MKISFTKKEIINLIVSALVLGFVFGFDDGHEFFDLQVWFSNYMFMVALSLISLTVMVLGHKWAAGRYSIQTEYNIWGISRFGFKDYQYIHKNKLMNRFPLGIILPIFIAVFSEGQIWLASVAMVLTSVNTVHRIGKKWVHDTDYEEARIMFAGIMATTLVIILFAFAFEKTGAELWKQLIFMNIALLLSHMLPFPQLAGGRMLFTSLYLFTFALAITAITSILVLLIPAVSTIMIAFILAVMTVIGVYFKREVN
ncbi:hypothetical protein J4208_02750 [Candidatus Woesearchaeota archaeon]|nr:hypothetical protein [Candidatus Woesearchaeota archaeon]